MSNQDSEKLRTIQEFANNYPIKDYFEPDEKLYCFSNTELADLLTKLWDLAKKETHRKVYEMMIEEAKKLTT